MTDKSDTIVISILGATVITYVGNVAAKKPITMKPLIGGFVAGTLLLGVGMWTGKIASSFATLILVSSVLINGTELFKAVGTLTGTDIKVGATGTGAASTTTPTRTGSGQIRYS